MGQLVEYVYAMAQTIADRDERIGKGGADESAGSGKGKVYVPATVDKMATFLNGGVEKFLERWVYEYIKYPDSAIRNGIRGTVVAEFVVDAKGKVKDVRIVGSLDDDIDAQVVKVIGASPKWKPATVAGKPVSVKISVPVEFKLAKSGSFKIKK
jgi:protein TonB